MRAAVITPDHSFAVEEVAHPAPGPGELVIRVESCGVCGSDLKAFRYMPPGAVLGHEFCGEVTAVGEGVPTSRIGQSVAAMPLRACGRCVPCRLSDPARCDDVELLGLGAHKGAFSEYIRVSADLAFSLPEGVGRLGIFVEPLAVGLHAVRSAKMQPGSRVLVLGGGSIGSAVTSWARRFGAGELVVSDPAAERRAAAAGFGASGVHDPAEGPPRGGFDVVIECVGGKGMLQTALDAATTRGTVVIAGVCIEHDEVDTTSALMQELTLQWSVYYSRKEFEVSAALLADPRFDRSVLVAQPVGLEAIGEAFEKPASGRPAKFAVTP
jgi:(R,R)-butanediol dehydrogenase/meso-butanediol dehydrogenase/diacetyl reductase